jgi:hypothetical protein
MYLCGGFVRDLFTDAQENDLDIWGSYKWHYRFIEDNIDSYEFECTSTKPKRCNHYMFQEKHCKITCKKQYGDDEISFVIDLGMGGGFHQYGLDYACNSLYLYYDNGWKFGVRFYEPELPKYNNENKFMYVPKGRVIGFDVPQIPFHQFVERYRTLIYYPQSHYPEYQDEVTALFQSLQERIAKLPQPPSLDTIIEQIRQRKLVPVTHCESKLDQYRIEHMLAKGYTQ